MQCLSSSFRLEPIHLAASLPPSSLVSPSVTAVESAEASFNSRGACSFPLGVNFNGLAILMTFSIPLHYEYLYIYLPLSLSVAVSSCISISIYISICSCICIFCVQLVSIITSLSLPPFLPLSLPPALPPSAAF